MQKRRAAMRYQVIIGLGALFATSAWSVSAAEPAMVPVGAAVVDITPDYPDPDGGL